jgi:8-oxo-dGTP diphosphatase
MPNKRMGAAAVIVDHAGRVLLVRHSYGKLNWDLPGGKSEVNESAQETAGREVLEETGLTVSVEQLTGVYYDPAYDMHHCVFRASVPGHQEPKPSSPEILACGYFALDELPVPISDFTYNRIKHAVLGDAGSVFEVIGPRMWIE